MFGILGTILLVSWLLDYALSLTSGFVQPALLVLACFFLALDFVLGKVRASRQVDVATPKPVIVK
jgi:hypothetical protein